MHVRQQLAEAAKALLADAQEEWQIVLATQWPPARDLGDYALVFCGPETVEAETVHPGHLQARAYTLSVRLRSRPIEGEAQEQKLARMQVEAETKLTTAALKAQLAGVKTLELQSVAVGDDEEDYARTYAEVALDWQVQIYTTEGAPETLIQ